MTNKHEDFIELIEDEPSPGKTRLDPHPWRILIVDDDEQVHTATLFALSDLLILGRRLEFLHAYSAQDARHILTSEDDIAVMFLDVVMETEDSGLKLVRVIREDLGLTQLRIILRTGQPGYAPELEAIRDYDINDYRTKSELTRTRLVTSLTTAIRSYEQLRTIATSRMGLEKIVRASAELFEKRALESLAEGVLTQIAGLLGFTPNGVVCAQRGYPLDGSDKSQLYVVGAVGRFATAINRPLSSLGDVRIEAAIQDCIQRRENVYAVDHTVLYIKSPGDGEEAVFLDSDKRLELLDRQLLEVFASNISVGFSNVYLFHRLNYQAYYDALTGLPNRQKLTDMIDLDWGGRGTDFIVFLVDIDHFADINDVMGSPFGDAMLRAIVQRLQDRLPGGVQIGRYGGDVLCVIGRPGEVSDKTLHDLFALPFEVDGYSLRISVTLGVCEGKPNQEGIDILKNAGLALTHAKRCARGRFVTYNEEMAQASRHRLDLLQALRRAISENQLELHYQPQVDLGSGRIIGAEALLRWYREDGQAVSPAVFIPLAEHSDLIQQIGEWVIFESCRQLARWREEGLGHLKVAINISARQIRLGACSPMLKQAIETHRVTPGQIEIEITESMVLDDIDAATACLQCFKDLGVSVALDDFGTGFSSLSYLHRLPIDCIKIDRAFMREVGQPGNGERIAEMIVALGKVLKLRTLAEGVETESQAEVALRWGCDSAQGYLYSPALRPDEFSAWVRDREAGSER